MSYSDDSCHQRHSAVRGASFGAPHWPGGGSVWQAEQKYGAYAGIDGKGGFSAHIKLLTRANRPRISGEMGPDIASGRNKFRPLDAQANRPARKIPNRSCNHFIKRNRDHATVHSALTLIYHQNPRIGCSQKYVGLDVTCLWPSELLNLSPAAQRASLSGTEASKSTQGAD